jgi:ribosomal protein S18 acetylase RimI-like enzyme
MHAMDKNSITTRPARPVLEEGLIYARYLDEAAEGFFRFLLGPRATDIIAEAFVEPNHDYSYDNVTFAEREGAIVGMVSGYSVKQRIGFSEEPLRQSVGKSALRMKVVKFLFAPLWRVLETVAEDSFYLQSVAVDDDLRGQGVGSLLMDSVEERARETKCAHLSLDVSAKNVGARRLYGHRGMSEESVWPRLKPIPPVLVRMTKEVM